MTTLDPSVDHVAVMAAITAPPIPEGFQAGYVALVGRPNAGKSTLLNQLLGEKVAIATPRVQTTRYRVRGVLTLPEQAQVVFVDTPGFSKALDKLGEVLTNESHSALHDADCVVLVVDGTQDPGAGDRWLAEMVKKTQKPVVLVVNKIDRLKDNALQTHRAQKYLDLLDGVAALDSLVLSAKTGRHVQKLVPMLLPYMPVQPPFYDEDTYTDQHLRGLATELIREKVMLMTQDELPHAVAVLIESFDESDPTLTRIEATLYVERETQKGIVIGHQGQQVKKIGQAARKDIEALLETKVFLGLQVKVKAHWRKDAQFLKQIGYTDV